MLAHFWERISALGTWKRARAYALVLVVLYAVAWFSVLSRGNPPLNASGTPLAGDYIAFHSAGRLILSGQASQLYDHASISRVQVDLLGGTITNFYDAYRNPPFFALLFAPLATLDLLPGFIVFTLISLLGLVLSLRLLADEAGWVRARWRGLLVLVLAFPPVYFGVIDGENALISLLLYVLIYRSMVRRQDTAAGAWAALGLFKPQLFVVFPLVFLVTRRWRALLAYAVVGLGLLGASLLLVGVDGLQAWLRILLEPEAGNSTVNAWRMTSLKSFFDALLSGSTPVSLGLYAVATGCALWTVVRAWTSGYSAATFPLLWGLTSLVAVLIDPHLVDYDLTVLVCAGVVAGSFVRASWLLVVALYVVTLLRLQVPAGDAYIQLAAPLLVCCAIALQRALVRATAGEALEAVPREPHWRAGTLVAPR